MSKLCKSCGNYYEGDHCDKCGYGDPNLKTHAADKYKKPTKPERFRTEEEKELYSEWEKEKKEDTEIKRHYDPNAGKKTLAIVAVVVIGVIVAVLYKSGVIFSSTKTDVIEKYFKSIQTSDFDSFVECFPKEMKNEYEQQRTEGGYGKEQVMKEVLYGDFIESYGADYTIDVSFGRETKLKESEYDLSEYKSFYGSAPNVSEAYEIVTNVTFKGSKGSEDAKLYIYVGKCSGKWCIKSIYHIIDIISSLTPNVNCSEPTNWHVRNLFCAVVYCNKTTHIFSRGIGLKYCFFSDPFRSRYH